MSLKHVARQTVALLEAGGYTAPSGSEVSLREAQAAAVAGTRLYTPEELAVLRDRPGTGPAPAIAVTDETTQAAAHRLAGAPGLAVLNFASARNPGGGFLNGARAQEEALCRSSGLYPTLLTQWAYYEANRQQRSLLYTDHLIHSPGVPWFRLQGRSDLLEAPFLASVITAPAPNAGPLLRQEPDAGPQVASTFARRWANVLAVARDRGHRTLVLGAWGCGAFGNDPTVAAGAVKPLLGSDAVAGMEHIVFAIPATGRQSLANHRAFVRVLA